jgi:RES domain-containing protein
LIHDASLLELLGNFPVTEFKGEVFRATRKGLNPLAFSNQGGRWAPRGEIGVLYTSMDKEGALAEIAFHWGQLTPLPSKPAILHTINATTKKTMRLIRADLNKLGVNDKKYDNINYEKTQQIGAAIAFLECDGLLVPSALCDFENLVIFSDNHDIEENELQVTKSNEVDWRVWARKHNFVS